MEPEQDFTKLNNELLREPKPEEEKVKPKRNSKDSIIHNILKVVEKYELDFDLSDSKMRRLNKEELMKVLAEVMEKSVHIDMAKSVGVDPRANGKVVTLGALRMLHTICATGFEKVFNQFATPYVGYESEGFSNSLKDPVVQSSVDECLAEIAAENPEILQLFDSPYSRLGLIWSGALMSSLKKKRYYQNVHNMGPQTNRGQNPASTRSHRSTEVRKEHGNNAPAVPTVFKV
jgi:hypothetical protein